MPIRECTHLKEKLEEQVNNLLKKDMGFQEFKGYCKDKGLIKGNGKKAISEALNLYPKAEKEFNGLTEHYAEFYCTTKCKDRKDCEIAEKYFKKRDERFKSVQQHSF